MDLNKEQNKALEDIYKIARVYGGVSTHLNGLVDRIKQQAEFNDTDAEFMEMFTRHQVCHMKDYMRIFYDMYTRTIERLDSVNTAFVNKD